MRNTRKKFRFASIIFSFIVLTTTVSGQITTNGAMTPDQLVNNVLLGGGITASNVTYTGYANSIAEFTATPGTGLGFSGGVYLTSGSHLQNDPLGFGGGQDGPAGPSSNFQSVSTGGWGTSGDPDLDAMVQILTNDPLAITNDAAVLEFDFVPTSDTVKFRYRFGSEEYNDFVPSGGGGIADVFAFFLSGVTTPMPPTNIALIPGGTTPVSIFTVNNGYSMGVSTGPCMNCAYYEDNINGAIDVVYDGMTSILTATAPVICGETYHIKIAIADASDNAYDSGVFLEAGSFSSNGQVSMTAANLTNNDTILYEGCPGAEITFYSPDSTVGHNLAYALSGTSTNGTDYTGLNGTLNFTPGQSSITVPVDVIADGITEGFETLIINVYDPISICGATGTATFYITEPEPISVDAGQDVTLDCNTLQAGAQLDALVNGGVGAINFAWNPSGHTTSSIVVNTAGDHIITVTDYCGQTDMDTVNITVIGANPLSVTASNDTTICSGNLVDLWSLAVGGNGGIQYQWSTGSSQANISVTPVNTATYTITVTDDCGLIAEEQVTVDVEIVDAKFGIQYTVNDGEVNFINLSVPPGSNYVWDFGDGNGSTDESPTHTYTEAGQYTVTLTVTNPFGCEDQITYQVNIEFPSYVYIPNAFTPGNDDGLNDVFQVHGQGFSRGVLRIFNRWGEEIHLDAEGDLTWSGKQSDKTLYPAGIYAYRFDYKDGAGKDQTMLGHVNLIR